MLGLPVGVAGSLVYEVVTLANSSSQVTLSSQFSSTIWQSSATKLVIIPSNVTIGSTSASSPALVTGTGMGGQLILQNYGSIQGAGGTANGGAGGSAFRADQSLGNKFLFQNYGTIYSGGGGGGFGGFGGSGTYNSTVTEGPYFSNTSPEYIWGEGTYTPSSGETVESLGITWDNIVVASETTGYPFPSSYYDGSTYTYYKVTYEYTFSGGHDSTDYYSLERTHIQTNSTSGGTGGSGGSGQGYNQSAATGSSGSTGGTNAGTGGTGGSGGSWGNAGSTGATGGSGNSTGGTTGQGGGSAGYSIVNRSYFSLVNSGTIIGSTSN